MGRASPVGFASGAGQTVSSIDMRHPLRLELARRNPHAVGCKVIKRRWMVERIFSRIGRNRRLAKDNDTLSAAVLSFVTAAAVQLGVRRVARMKALGSGSQPHHRLNPAAMARVSTC